MTKNVHWEELDAGCCDCGERNYIEGTIPGLCRACSNAAYSNDLDSLHELSQIRA